MVQTSVKHDQALLFSEPLYSETGVWCELHEGIDPAQWAFLCRSIGTLSPRQFDRAKKRVIKSPDSVVNRLKRIFSFEQCEVEHLPLVCMDPAGIRQGKQTP